MSHIKQFDVLFIINRITFLLLSVRQARELKVPFPLEAHSWGQDKSLLGSGSWLQ
jgi:hypothetical protein